MLTTATESLDLAEVVAHFREHGFAPLGQVLTQEGATLLAARADGLMLGASPHPGVFYQHDSPTGRYEDLKFGAGWLGPSHRYRKLEKLEAEPHFASFIENAFFAGLTRALLGANALLYRSVLWNKAPRLGMAVPWHQDDGRFWGLDRPPSLQVWTALDDAPPEAGCLEVVPGTHLRGLATPEGGTIPGDLIESADAETRRVRLPARRGESFLVHNHTWHRTGPNRTAAPRRAVSISFLEAGTRCRRRRRAPREFKQLFGSSPEQPADDAGRGGPGTPGQG